MLRSSALLLASQCVNSRLVGAKILAASAALPARSVPQPISFIQFVPNFAYTGTYTTSSSSHSDPAPYQDKHDNTSDSEREVEAKQDIPSELASETLSIIPWYLQANVSQYAIEPILKRQWLPALPENPPPLLQPILEYMSTDLGLDALSILDLRKLDPPSGLGANLLMILTTARSEKHLHVSADRFCRWLRSSHKLFPYADGLMGRGELKLKLRRKARRAKLLSSVGSSESTNADDGLRTGWICVNVGVIEAEENALDLRQEPEIYVDFDEQFTGARLVVQMMTEEKREELNLEELWGTVLARRAKRNAKSVEPLPERIEEVGLSSWSSEVMPADGSSLIMTSHRAISHHNRPKCGNIHSMSRCSVSNGCGEDLLNFLESARSYSCVASPRGHRKVKNVRRRRPMKIVLSRMDRFTRTSRMRLLVALRQHQKSISPPKDLVSLKRTRSSRRLIKRILKLAKIHLLALPKKTTYSRPRRRMTAQSLFRNGLPYSPRNSLSKAMKEKSHRYLSSRSRFRSAIIPLPASQQNPAVSVDNSTALYSRKKLEPLTAKVNISAQYPDRSSTYFEKITRPSTKIPINYEKGPLVSMKKRNEVFLGKPSPYLSEQSSVQVNDRMGPTIEQVTRPFVQIPIPLTKALSVNAKKTFKYLVEKASRSHPEKITVPSEDHKDFDAGKLDIPLPFSATRYEHIHSEDSVRDLQCGKQFGQEVRQHLIHISSTSKDTFVHCTLAMILPHIPDQTSQRGFEVKWVVQRIRVPCEGDPVLFVKNQLLLQEKRELFVRNLLQEIADRDPKVPINLRLTRKIYRLAFKIDNIAIEIDNIAIEVDNIVIERTPRISELEPSPDMMVERSPHRTYTLIASNTFSSGFRHVQIESTGKILDRKVPVWIGWTFYIPKNNSPSLEKFRALDFKSKINFSKEIHKNPSPSYKKIQV